MIRRHLMLAPRRVHDGRLGVISVLGDHHATRTGQRLIGAVRFLQLGSRPTHELVNITVVVGEQDKALHSLDGRTRVVTQSRQREIRAQAIELRQGEILGRIKQTIRYLITDMGQFRRREPARDRCCHRAVQHYARTIQNIRERDFLIRRANFESGTIFVRQQGQLFQQIIAEQIRTRNGRRIDARARQAGKRTRLKVLGLIAKPADSQFWIGK